MVTLEQIKAAYVKVKSGADFPRYIQDLKVLGVSRYETFVSDGHTVFVSTAQARLSSDPKYAALTIAGSGNKEQFVNDLRRHQQGGTDYPTFCSDCAKAGVEKWTVDIDAMTCTYFDKAGEIMLVETIPGV